MFHGLFCIFIKYNFVLHLNSVFVRFLLQALCILTNIANGKTAKDYIMGNDDLVGKIVSYLVNITIDLVSYYLYFPVGLALLDILL